VLEKYNIDIRKKVFRIGISLRTLDTYSNRVIVTFLGKVLSPLLRKYKDALEIIFVPFGYGSTPDSFLIMILLANLLKAELDFENFKIIREEFHPRVVLTLFKIFDIFIGERFHSIISAILIGVPIIAIVYDIKIKEFLKRYDNRYILEKVYCNDIESARVHKIRSIIESVIKRKIISQ